MANKEGMALELKDIDWPTVDGTTLTQEERSRQEAAIGEYIKTKTKQELFDAAVERGILLVPIANIKDVMENPQFAAREFWVQVEHPELGETFTYPGWPIKMSELPPYQPQRRAPLIGEHNREIYEKELGLSKDKLILLNTRGVI